MTAAELWQRLPWRQRAALRFLDILINWRWTGELQTLTETFAQRARAGNIGGIWACQLLNRIDPGHCQRALDHPPVLTDTDRLIFDALQKVHQYHLAAEEQIASELRRHFAKDDQT